MPEQKLSTGNRGVERVRRAGSALLLGAWAAAVVTGTAVASEGVNPFEQYRGRGINGEFFQPDAEISKRAGDEHGYRIVYTRWLPDTPNGKLIVYNHGFQSHRGWFNATANVFAEAGYTVYAFDRISSGESGDGLARRRGEVVGVRGHVRAWELFTETLDLMVKQAVTENPGQSVVLWGNSYGARVLTAYLMERADELQARRIGAVIFTTPGLFSNDDTMPLPFSKVRLVTSSALTLFPLPMVERDGDNGAAWFVAPGTWFDHIRDDTLSLREVTRTFYLQTRSMDRLINRRSSPRIEIPTFYLMVRGDVMMDNDRMEQHIASHTADAWFKYYRGGPQEKHFLLFTEDRDAAIGNIMTFLDGGAGDIADVQRGPR